MMESEFRSGYTHVSHVQPYSRVQAYMLQEDGIQEADDRWNRDKAGGAKAGLPVSLLESCENRRAIGAAHGESFGAGALRGGGSR